MLAVVQRTPDNPQATDVPDAWADQADKHDARSFDVVRFGYDGSINRTVVVATSAATEALSKVYGQTALVKELTGK